MNGTEGSGSRRTGDQQEFASPTNNEDKPHVAVNVSDQHGKQATTFSAQDGHTAFVAVLTAMGLHNFRYKPSKTAAESTSIANNSCDVHSLEQAVRLADESRVSEFSAGYNRCVNVPPAAW